MKGVVSRTRAEKAEAVGLAEAIGIKPAARRLGIAESSLRYWRDDPEFARLRAEQREAVAEDVWAAFQRGLARIVELLPHTEDLAKVAVATGILYDKHALLTGGATNRSESRDISGTISDAELVATIREAERITGAERTPTEAPGAPEG